MLTSRSLRRVSRDEKLTPYVLKLNIGLHQQGYTKQSKLLRIQCIYQACFPMRTLGVSLESCLPPAFAGFPGRLTGPFQGPLSSQGYSLQNHTERSPTLASLCDMFSLLNELNLSLQGRATTVFKLTSKEAAFRAKLELWGDKQTWGFLTRFKHWQRF